MGPRGIATALPASLIVLLLAAPAAGYASTCPSGDPVCKYQEAATETEPSSSSTSTLPGAIQPQPVNVAVEEQFWADVAANRARGTLASQLGVRGAELVPDLQTGSAGWCLLIAGAEPPVPPRCPVSPAAGRQVAWESWEADGSSTRGFVLAGPHTAAVAVDEGSIGFALSPVPGVDTALTAAAVSIAAPFPAPTPIADVFDPVGSGGIREAGRGWFDSPFAPADSYPATEWKARAAPPASVCGLSARPLRGLRVAGGSVLGSLHATPGIAGGGFVSCAETRFTLRGTAMAAALLLDAADPGVAPPVTPPLSRSLPGHSGLLSAPGRGGPLLARREREALLLVEGGSLRAREQLLAALRERLGA